ncbi:DUF3592 domain-containing protein [Actinomadura alba]|uniref:DUF3592 domain-containing protein n=1 Tax=Actinomadura alba TaxID=406431 RepID=A0ABR7LZL6_9ACTN|nr:DUF3592 domain-containing protein [Actinomadura alba]MBC6470287.1 hypothetical protein [Actinomadura alba]
MAAMRIRRRDLWRAYFKGAPRRLRRAYVWVPLLIGLICVFLAVGALVAAMDFRRNAVTTTAIVEEIQRPAPLMSEDGLTTHRFYGRVRYTVNGATVRSRVLLYRCVSSSCSFRQRTGDTVEIAYDPRKVTHATRATAAETGGTTIGWISLLVMIAAISLFTGVVNLLLGRREPGK